MSKKRKKIICIAGATASGKSSMAEKIAQERNGVIISADSRQVYKHLPFFSGISEGERDNHLVGFLDEWKSYSASDFVSQAEEKMAEIWGEGKVPVVVGGTSFYFKSLLYENFIPAVEQNEALRKELAGKDTDELMLILEGLDPVRAKSVDVKNRPRIVRSIEIATELGSVPVVEDAIKKDLDIEFIWINIDREQQKTRIEENFRSRMKNGFLDEAVGLRNILMKRYNGNDDLVKQRFFEIGLAYKYIFRLWEGKIDEEEFVHLGILEEQKYAKRQDTYLKKFYKGLPEKFSERIVVVKKG